MKWSPQKPQRKAREGDEEKIKQWKTERWPELRAKADNLANFSPKELWELSKAAREALIRKRRRPKLIRAFRLQT